MNKKQRIALILLLIAGLLLLITLVLWHPWIDGYVVSSQRETQHELGGGIALSVEPYTPVPEGQR